jgi:predicted nucleic acid-binding protein
VHFFYLDASALAKRYASEIGTPLIDRLFAQVSLDRLYVFNIGVAEVVSLLVRKKNTGHLAAPVLTQALLEFGKEICSATLVRKLTADHGLVTAALPLIELHSLNATDAVILSSALDLVGDLRKTGDDLALVASDQRLLRAAQTEGLTTLNPETQTQADLDVLL